MGPKRARTTQGSSSRAAAALPFRMRDDRHQQRLQTLVGFEFHPTGCLDSDILETHGLLVEVSHYIASIGWERVQEVRCATYREPVLEFLSSVTYFEPAHSPDHPLQPRVFFQLGGGRHDILLSEFNILCRFETGDSVQTAEYQEALLDYPPDFIDADAWRELTGRVEPYEPRKAKSSAIRDPALRVIHRWLALSIFARKESTGNVSRHHLLILWCMMHNRRVNAGRFLLHSCTSLGAKLSVENVGHICIGSFVSRLALSLRHVSPTHQRLFDMTPITTDTLFWMGVLVRAGDGQFILAPPAPPPAAEGAGAPDPPAPEQPPPGPPHSPPHADDHPDFQQRLDQLQSHFDQRMDRYDGQLVQFSDSIHQRLSQQDEQIQTIIQMLSQQFPPPS